MNWTESSCYRVCSIHDDRFLLCDIRTRFEGGFTVWLGPRIAQPILTRIRTSPFIANGRAAGYCNSHRIGFATPAALLMLIQCLDQFDPIVWNGIATGDLLQRRPEIGDRVLVANLQPEGGNIEI